MKVEGNRLQRTCKYCTILNLCVRHPERTPRKHVKQKAKIKDHTNYFSIYNSNYYLFSSDNPFSHRNICHVKTGVTLHACCLIVNYVA